MIYTKSLMIILALIVLISVASFSAQPVNLSIFPPLAIYQNPDIEGLDLGLFGTKSRNVTGIQWSWIYNKADSIYGAQIGWVNISGKVKGLQWGLVNITDNLYGVQIGLVNMAKSGAYFPFMVIINAGF